MKVVLLIFFIFSKLLFANLGNEVEQLENQKKIFNKLEENKNQKILQYDIKKPKLSEVKKGSCVNIKEIKDEGITLLSSLEKYEVYKKYLNRCNSVTDLNNLTKELTALYYEKGYITSKVYLKAQNLSKGLVTLHAIEGKVESIRPKKPFIDVVFLGQKGDFLNLRDIETSLEVINRLSSNNATMKLVPSKKSGYSDIVVKNRTSKRLLGSLGVNNFGSKTTGKIQGALSFSLENPLEINDILSLSLNSTEKHMQKENSIGDMLSYSFPTGRLNTTLSARRSKYKQLISAGIVDYESKGETKTYKLKFDYKFFHNRNNRVSLGSSISQARTKNYLVDTLIESSSYNLAKFDFWVDYLFRSSSFYTFLTLSYTKGVDWFDSYNPTSLNEKYELYNLNFTFIKNLSWAKYTLSAYGQYAKDALFNSAQISMGGHYSVRGYQKEGLSGNSGYYVRNEFSKTFSKRLLGLFEQTYFIGFDGGWIKKEADTTGGILFSYLFGLRLKKDNFYAELYGAVPVHKEDVSDTKSFFGASLEYKF